MNMYTIRRSFYRNY